MSRQITINDILKMFLAHIKLIIILALVGAIVSFAYVKTFVTEMYSTTALLLVQNDAFFTQGGSSTVTESDSEKINTNDITSSITLAENCSIIFTNDPDMTRIISSNSGTVAITPIENSYFLEIKVTSDDRDKAANIANQLAAEAHDVFGKYFADAGKIDTVREASVPGAPSSPDVKKFVILGFLAGLILALGISFLIEIVDTTIKPGDDLYAMYNIPVFAEIVDFELEGGAKKK